MPIIVPIVAFITLAAWLGIVFWADANPAWKPHSTNDNESKSTGDAMPVQNQTLARKALDAAEKRGADAVARRSIRFLGGILVVAVPAYFTFLPPVPGTTGWPGRDLIMTGWLLVLIFAVFIASAHDISIDQIAATARGSRKIFRKAAADDILRRLLAPADDVAKDYTLALYLPDQDNPELLTPIPRLGHQVATSWRVGTGVTGTAYSRKAFLIGQGDDLKPGGRFGPQPDQSSHLQEYRTVVAQPIISASEQVLGVLTAATTTAQRNLLSAEGRELLEDLATDISRVLIDMLGYKE